jgi:hypothetical protein
MKKIITLTVAFVSINLAANAQATDNKSVMAKMDLTDAIDLAVTNNATPPAVTFLTPADFSDGKNTSSTPTELLVRSTNKFSIKVRTNGNTFTYAGPNTPDAIPMSSVLGLKIINNTTGGTIQSPYSTAAYQPIQSTDQPLISTGTNGDNQRFTVAFEFRPGFKFPGGLYTAEIVFTASQP